MLPDFYNGGMHISLIELLNIAVICGACMGVRLRGIQV